MMSDDNTAEARLIASDPTPGQFIRELHCWIATYPDGTEGIMASGFEGLGMMPLFSSRRATAEMLEPSARRIQQTAMHQANQIVSIRLVTFSTTEGPRQ
jgi:hypothetical protein